MHQAGASSVDVIESTGAHVGFSLFLPLSLSLSVFVHVCGLSSPMWQLCC